MPTFIIPGGLPHLARISDYLNEDICGILVHDRTDASEIRFPGIAGKIYTLRSLVELNAQDMDKQEMEVYERYLANVLADPRVHYLAMRSHFNSAFNNSIVIEKVLVNSIQIIRKSRASRLIASSTPHSVEAWVFAKCFEYMHLPVYILERTPVINRAWIYRGMDTQEVVEHEGKEMTAVPGHGLSDMSRRLIREQRESKPGARDENGFYVSRMDMNSVAGADSNRFWSYAREWSQLRSGRLMSLPLRLLSAYRKRSLYASYGQVAAKDLPTEPFVIYFMHYQPERSSLPEGLFHAQQWTAIRLLSWSLPEGWTLLVREHPSTWLLPLDISVRTPDIYKEISMLRNTKVCSMEIDTFELIDRCSAVATLTGSVGFQAILRNRPVIVFGLAGYKDHPACFSVSSFTDLVEAFNGIRAGVLHDDFGDDALRRYLKWLERNSLCADPDENDIVEARLKNFTEIYRRVLCGEIELH